MAVKMRFPDQSTFNMALSKHLKSGMFAIMLADDDAEFTVMDTGVQRVLDIAVGGSHVYIGMSPEQAKELGEVISNG